MRIRFRSGHNRDGYDDGLGELTRGTKIKTEERFGVSSVILGDFLLNLVVDGFCDLLSDSPLTYFLSSPTIVDLGDEL